jgi:Ca-activated chloride channel family protein
VRFESPFLLVLIPILLLLLPFWFKRAQPPRIQYSLPIPRGVRLKNWGKALLALKVTGLLLFVVALARPQSSYRQTERRLSGVDIMLVMDVSRSMDIEDLAEASRLDVAKETMKDFVQARRNDRIGFIMFSGEPVTKAPPTLDYGLVLKAIDDAQTSVLKDGTAIGDGLALAVNRLRNSKAKSRIIILVTDGDNNSGQVDPGTAGEIAAGYGIRVYTIAIGREGRVRMPIVEETPSGRRIVNYQWFNNALNPELLKKIAEVTQGKFYRVTEAGALESVFKEIDRMEKSDFQTKEKTRYEDIFDVPLKLGVLLLLLAQALSLGVWRVFA